MQVFLIAIFGVVGVLSRYGVDLALSRFNTTFPWSTFLVNFLGCLLAGAIWGLQSRSVVLPPTLALAILVGFCGGFTTFSAFAVQTLNMVDAGAIGTALRYAILSPAAALVGVFLGACLTRLS